MALVGLVFLLLASLAHARVNLVTLPGRDSVQLTIYSAAAWDNSGGRKMNSAGSWISPPPPTMESTKPASNAATQR